MAQAFVEKGEYWVNARFGVIEQVVWFALGALFTAVVWSALMPAFWARAVRLTAARLERALPLSLEEIAAERDRLRASFAVSQRRLEEEVERKQAEVQAAREMLGRKLSEIQDLSQTIAQRRQDITALEHAETRLQQTITTLETELAAARKDRDLNLTKLSGAELVREALDAKLAALTEVSDQRRIELANTSVALDRTKLQLAETDATLSKTRQDMAELREDLRRAQRRIDDDITKIAILEHRLAAANAEIIALTPAPAAENREETPAPAPARENGATDDSPPKSSKNPTSSAAEHGDQARARP